MALASLNADIILYTRTIPMLMQSRVIDGYGYYHALFKRRLTIRTAQIPNEISNEQLPSFDQGVGRSLWYLAEGDLLKLERFLNLIQKSRYSDIWRGIGIAYSYVGGDDISDKNKIVKITKEYYADFLSGIALMLYSRKESGIFLDSSSVISESFLNDSQLAISTISNYNSSGTLPELLKSLKVIL